MQIHFRLEDHGVRAMLEHLTVHHPVVVSKAMNRVIFDMREAETKMVAQAFDYWSAVTRTFIANEKSFPFEMAKPGKLEAKLFAGGIGGRSATAQIFSKQETGFTLKPGEKEQLSLSRAYAVPTDDPGAQLRTPRGRVKPSLTPGALVKGTKKLGLIKIKRRRRRQGHMKLGTHVFVSPKGKAIVEVTPGGGRRVLYSLYQKPVKVDEHIEFFATAEVVVNTSLMPKLLQEWDKSFGRFGA